MIASLSLERAWQQGNNYAYVLGITSRVRVISANTSTRSGEVAIRFPTLFPFWRLAVSPDREEKDRDSGIAILAGLTSLIALLLGFTVIVFTRASWRRWRFSEVREDFVRGVSHDFRGPVANIAMYSEMLLDQDFEPTQLHDLHATVYQEARRLSDLTTRVLELSRRKRATNNSPDRRRCNPKAIVDEAIRIAEARYRSQGFRIELRQPDTFPLILCDSKSLLRCVVDLLDNAVKYSGDSRRIEVETCATEDAFQISVRDFGIGIPKNEIPRIFEEFYRASNVRNTDGYGIGLYLVKSTMEEHGGRVEVISAVNLGSEFRLILPL